MTRQPTETPNDPPVDEPAVAPSDSTEASASSRADSEAAISESETSPTPQTDRTPATQKGRTIRIGSQRSAVDLQKARQPNQREHQPIEPSKADQSPVAVDAIAPPQADGVSSTAGSVEPTRPSSPISGGSPDSPPAQDEIPHDAGPIKTSRTPAEIPQLSADLEREIDEALGDISLDQLIEGEELADVGDALDVDTRRHATVVKLHRDDVFFSLGTRNEGVALLKQFDEPPQVGATMDVVVTGFNANEGLYELAIPGASVDVGDWSDLVEGMVVEALVTASNTGGLECEVNRLRGFIPASQIGLYRVENFEEYVGQKMQCVVSEANPQRRNLVLSRRTMLERQREENREKFLAELEVGQIREGTVRNLRDFGAFVDLGGVDGLIHVSKMSWDRVNHPSDVLKEGQSVKVKIEKIDPQTGKIGLSYRDLLENPWTSVEGKYPVNTVVSGTVSRIAKFGAFVKLEPGVEGLIHISELAHHRVSQVSSVVSEGQSVDVKVVSVDSAEQRIGLSLKATQLVSSSDDDQATEEAPRESAAPRRNKPLKGGIERPSGGDRFGLNW